MSTLRVTPTAWLTRALSLAGYLAVVALGTLLRAGPALDAGLSERLAAALHPSVSGADFPDAIRNVALFTGWGLLWVLTAPAQANRRRLIVGATIGGAVASFAIELSQLLFTSRTASLIDVATNTVGAALGAALTLLFLALLGASRGARSFLGLPTWLLAASYALAAVGEAIIPLFRQRLAAGAWGPPGQRLRVVLQLFKGDPSWSLPLTDLLLFAPVGFLVVAALVEAGRSYRSAVVGTVTAGALAAIVLEFGHGLLGVPIRMGALLVHAIAIAAGALLCARLLPRFSRSHRGAARPRWALGLYATVLLLWLTRPYRIDLDPLSLRIKLAYPWWIPLGDARWRIDLFEVFDVVGGFLLFLPLGALLAVWPLRRRGPLSGVWPVLYFATLVEASQFLLYLRTATVTDPMVQVSAAAIGWAAMRRVGFRPYGTVLGGDSARR
ncbi:MAG: VanZ family protein [Gemmatimonadota bacterium]